LVGDLVLKENHHKTKAKKEDKGEFEINLIGPYIVKVKYPHEAYNLVNIYEREFKFSTNAIIFKPFYA